MTSRSTRALIPKKKEGLESRDLAEFGVARFRGQLFDAVSDLWRRRKSEGWTNRYVAEAIGRDAGWVSRNLRAPGNWTTRIAGELIQGLRGDAEVRVFALEDSVVHEPSQEARTAALMEVRTRRVKDALSKASSSSCLFR